MNYKVLFTFFAVVIAAALVVVGYTRSTGSKQSSQPVITAAGDTNVNNNLVSNNGDSPAAIIADVNADADAKDVLIAAAKAKTAPALSKGQWLNSEATGPENLRGRVVLVDFWTFGCYNCRNTLPALKQFDAAYREKGLTIVGVHTPETDYEKDFNKVKEAVNRLGIKYPVVTDTNSETWQAFGIEAWPTVVILDRQGRMRYSHIGEGAYDVQEKVIKTLLAEDNALQKPDNKSEQTAVFAGGCFWGMEAVFEHVKGVSDVVSGYSGGDADTADYETVSTGETGHAESVKITFDPSQVSYETLLKVFFSVAHNPTELDRQGPDEGTQYRSAIFYADEEQKQLAETYIAGLIRAKTFSQPIVTQIVPLKAFYKAEDYHQNYLALHPDQPYIVVNDQPKVDNLHKQFPELFVSNKPKQ